MIHVPDYEAPHEYTFDHIKGENESLAGLVLELAGELHPRWTG